MLLRHYYYAVDEIRGVFCWRTKGVFNSYLVDQYKSIQKTTSSPLFLPERTKVAPIFDFVNTQIPMEKFHNATIHLFIEIHTHTHTEWMMKRKHNIPQSLFKA